MPIYNFSEIFQACYCAEICTFIAFKLIYIYRKPNKHAVSCKKIKKQKTKVFALVISLTCIDIQLPTPMFEP